MQTLSDSGGFIYDPAGIDAEKLAWIVDLKTRRRGRISEYVDEFGGEYHADARPWAVPTDFALPCATQNELNGDEAKVLVANGLKGVSEGANMPSTQAAVDHFIDSGVLYAPSKAANAGGVAVSGLEMSQNQARMSWEETQLDAQLKSIMGNIHAKCVEYGTQPDGAVNYLKGANIAGFVKVADAMLAYGVM